MYKSLHPVYRIVTSGVHAVYAPLSHCYTSLTNAYSECTRFLAFLGCFEPKVPLLSKKTAVKMLFPSQKASILAITVSSGIGAIVLMPSLLRSPSLSRTFCCKDTCLWTVHELFMVAQMITIQVEIMKIQIEVMQFSHRVHAEFTLRSRIFAPSSWYFTLNSYNY